MCEEMPVSYHNKITASIYCFNCAVEEAMKSSPPPILPYTIKEGDDGNDMRFLICDKCGANLVR